MKLILPCVLLMFAIYTEVVFAVDKQNILNLDNVYKADNVPAHEIIDLHLEAYNKNNFDAFEIVPLRFF
ncbi:hypothetical protein PCIT_b1257 [Pseudoalteromonas citrea]|uniref:Uncharacterized protein n=2 Tax=Pseudoalteromonas citrea TaxID=43655 RepID=A0AAD4FQK9_9GAMM|nr:hypothetical protein [Pseudoalteromonas citrea]KAF7765109.1 hypothetical protein PCIT_b1257 [Pseudoalteromonas citrea]